jgi:hypothetical protein
MSTNLADANKPSPLARALIGTDLGGVSRILATDDWWLAEDVNNVSTDAEEMGMGAGDKPGLYLFTGRCQLTYDYESGQPDGSEWVGELRPVKPEEVAELYAMVPSEPSFDNDFLLNPEQAQAAYDSAESVPLSKERIDEIVEYATRPRNFGDLCPNCGCAPCACPPGD